MPIYYLNAETSVEEKLMMSEMTEGERELRRRITFGEV